jgi:hypothetical protein
VEAGEKIVHVKTSLRNDRRVRRLSKHEGTRRFYRVRLLHMARNAIRDGGLPAITTFGANIPRDFSNETAATTAPHLRSSRFLAERGTRRGDTMPHQFLYLPPWIRIREGRVRDRAIESATRAVLRGVRNRQRWHNMQLRSALDLEHFQ